MLLYADETDLLAWGMTELPDNAISLIRQASILVGRATSAAIYDVDGAGKPSDPDLVQALRDATCAQVEMWDAADINPVAAGVGKTAPSVIQKSLGGRSVQYADPSSSVTVVQARAEAATKLCDISIGILAAAGLLGGQPWST